MARRAALTGARSARSPAVPRERILEPRETARTRRLRATLGYLRVVRICLLALLLIGCANRAPCQTLKAENKRLHDELADSRRHQTETDDTLKALQAQVARLDQSTKAKDAELAKVRTESSATSRELADTRSRVAEKPLPTVQCPQGTALDTAQNKCVPVAPPPAPVVTPAPPPPPQPVTARVIKLDFATDGVVCTVAAGSDNGVQKTWRARFLRGSTTLPLVGGKATIIRVDRRTTTVRVNMTTDAITQNPNVELSP